MYNPTAKSYFSGAGLMDIGMKQAGVDVIQSVDICGDSVRHMRNNPHWFGHEIIQADIAGKTVLDQPRSDMSFFTYPCTKYSTIADIHGTRTGDELFLHALRHIAIDQPDMYVVENVPGMKIFPVVMEAMTKLPGYYMNIFCPVDAATWLPQRRKRLILFGTRRPFTISAPEASTKRVTMKEVFDKNARIEELPAYVKRRINGDYRDKPIIVDPYDPAAIAPTCVAHYSKDRGTRMIKDKRHPDGVRPFTVREWARLQGVPDDVIFEDSLSSFRLIGNGVPCHMGKWAGSWAVKYFNQSSIRN